MAGTEKTSSAIIDSAGHTARCAACGLNTDSPGLLSMLYYRPQQQTTHHLVAKTPPPAPTNSDPIFQPRARVLDEMRREQESGCAIESPLCVRFPAR
ncbi:hypothetical protein MRB53_042285 [Persea americana]|nr:hypothetical protein MRB53_042285 [Persea americana]